MPRDGDRRPIRPTQGRDLDYASLLCAAMCEGSSEESKRFNLDRENLFLRWERLLRVLICYQVPGWAGPPSTLDRIESYLETAVVSHLLRPVWYPKPRPVTAEEDRHLHLREAVASEALVEIYQDLRPYEGSSSEQANQEWEDVTSFLLHWVDETAREANAQCKIRNSRRTAVQRYRQEVADFCQKWGLHAWWAVPALVQSHFFRIEAGYDQLLGLYIKGAGEVPKFTIIVQIPGTTEEQFECDQKRFTKVMFETVVGLPGRR